jgi:quercetin dioxygenase-like cupin family protein
MALHTSSRTAAALCALGMALALPAPAQTPSGAASAVNRTEMGRGDVTAPGREAVVMKVEIAPGGHTPRHTHPGDEITYVADGDGTLLVDGEVPRKFKAGDVFVIKEGKVHKVRNDGSKPIHLLDVYVVEKGKPLATPAK